MPQPLAEPCRTRSPDCAAIWDRKRGVRIQKGKRVQYQRCVNGAPSKWSDGLAHGATAPSAAPADCLRCVAACLAAPARQPNGHEPWGTLTNDCYTGECQL
jgi:hypothetical protein